MDGSPYSSVFDAAVEGVLADEGGYSDNRADRGGPTNFGISQREYPKLDIKNLSRDEAIAIYYRDYWLKFSIDKLPASISAKILDLAVLMGPHSAIQCLQNALRACGVEIVQDGVIGVQTSRASGVVETNFAVARSKTPPALTFTSPLLAAIRSEAAGDLRFRVGMNAKFGQFARGWTDRAYR